MPKARPVSLRLALVLAVVAQLAVNAGSGFAVRAFELAGPAALVALRNGLSALVWLALARPRLRGLTGRAWAGAISYGLALAVMNSFFYQGIELIPVGPAVTIEMLGPLTLSVVLARGWRAWLWAGLALVGVAMLSGFDFAGADRLGVGLILAAGAAWAGYILAARWVGRLFADSQGLAIGLMVAALASLPRGLPALASRPLSWQVLGWGALVAATGTLIPYALEMVALRGLAAATFGVTTALAPASAAVFGWLIAGQTLGWAAAGGVALVTAAAAGAALDESRGRRPPKVGLRE